VGSKMEYSIDREKLKKDSLLADVRKGRIKTLEEYISMRVEEMPDSIIALLTTDSYAETGIMFSVQLAWMADFYDALKEANIRS